MTHTARHPVRFTGIARGPEFEIDLSAFPEGEPRFAYVDDVDGGVAPLRGLAVDGRITIAGLPSFMWLDGPRDCVLLEVTTEGRRDGRVSLRSLAVGEFCLELYYVRRDGSSELLHADDFCCK